MRFNVIGHITSEIGLGVMAADMIRALHAAGHEVVGFDVDPGLNRRGRNHDLNSFLRPEHAMFRDGVDVAIFPVSVSDHWSRSYRFGKRRVAVPLWELPDINPAWLAGLRRFDGIFAPSEFIADTLTQAGINVWRGAWPHYITDAKPDRAKFGLPADKVVFTFAFDPSSDVQRKNPQAIVKAFQEANAPDALLCIQINRSVEKFPDLDKWLAGLAPERVKVIGNHLSHADAVQLIASSDVYISLHRAEGLGLGMLEAMQCGRQVIATAWSGNMSFMDEVSACLVDADLIPLNGTIPAYTERVLGRKSQWAEPDIELASRWITVLAHDETIREVKSESAKAKADEYQAEARRLEWIDNLTQIPLHATGHSAAKVLIFTPTWIDPLTGEDAIKPEVEAAVKSQRCVDFDWHITTDNPYPVGDHRNVLHQYQQAREYFLHGKWDVLITLEHDNLLPDDEAIYRLCETPGDVVYGVYMLRHGRPMLNTWQYVNDKNLGMSLSNYPRELRNARKEIVHRVSGAGMGCTLFQRHIIEAIPFEGSSRTNACPDLGFAEKAIRAGYLSNGRFDVPLAHWHDGRWLYPFGDWQGKMKYMALQTVRALAGNQGRAVQLTQGQEIELSDDEAKDLARVGYIAYSPPVERAVVDSGAEKAIAPAQKRTPRKRNE